jgi:hypothetical protein
MTHHFLNTTPKGDDFSGDGHPVPNSLELFGVFQSILEKGAGLSADYLGLPVEGPSVMSLERSVYLSGSFQGLWVVRAHRKLVDLVIEKTAVRKAAPVSEEAVFDQWVERFCLEALKTFWKPSDFKPFSINHSNPRLWPQRTPISACAFLVEHYPVEIRFWMETGLSPAGEEERGGIH